MFQCYDINIVTALDDTIHDGVYVISLSLGDVTLLYNIDIIAIGAFHALEKDIIVSSASGNSGPLNGTVTNVAPWILTVGASSIDRNITPNSTVFPIKPAPVAAGPSSRGPSFISPDIIKPDVSVPGASILAAWSGARPAMDPSGKFVRVNYAIASGTSFACPHATGTATFIKSVHPSWSPAAIKSAIMTTGRRSLLR
ncbi:subtilisin-like protease SBT5.3 [Selaginella moellendorffii]|uniref:subtilisin-like protease SBT5.3 n=1 Tax=Selaginella moellendorffii TaxID=88036 RepID=UPI000D1C84EC|nr:subtilisin-like protease SBT5.3 [Selaginella moellendorffii]XP_024524870.1 subtilisin-like protease SBT5.3 [Selaginella moellendorffii]XP_024524871.1 subtilisin-like protease SBT5.3 [Selaginella moellendorffii]|eukprot:XP_024524869.1 subtilisin-like protease SBT5.3 [Selaginella moellendorffii]